MSNNLIVFKNKERMTRKEAADFLHQIADKISEGKVQLKQGQETVNLDLPSNVILEVEVKDKDKSGKGVQHKLEVEVKWFDGDNERGRMEIG